MRIKEYVKRNHWKRIFAIVLLVGCVLPMLPTDLFANWRITPTETMEVTKGGGDGKLTFRYFANDLYMPATGNYKYYTVDAYNNGGEPFYEGGQLSLENNAAAVKEKMAALGLLPAHTATYTATVTASSNEYCTGTSNECSRYENAPAAQTVATQSQNATGTVAVNGVNRTLQMGTVTFSVTFGGGSTSILNYQATDASKLSVSNAVNLDDETGALLYAVPHSHTSVAPSSASCNTVNGTNHVYDKILGFIERKHNAKQCNYSCNVSYELSYYAFIEIPPEKATTSGGSYEIANTSYTVSNLVGVGASVNAPTLSTLTGSLSDTVRPYLKYVEGFYTGVTVSAEGEGDAKRNRIDLTGATRVQFPYSLQTLTSDEIWVHFIPNNPGDFNHDARQDLNAEIQAGGKLSVVGVAPGAALPTDPTLNVVAKTIQTDKTYYNMTATNGTTSNQEHFFQLYSSIPEGMILHFAMNDGRTDVDAREGVEPEILKNSVADLRDKDGTFLYETDLTDESASLDNNVRDYTVKLQNDVTIGKNAQVFIGGYTGNYANGSHGPTGYIVDHYVALDLNGHTLYVEGTLHSFGYVYDSVGTGKIVVRPTGKLYTQLLIYGLSGLQHTLKSYGMGYSPFEDYNIPYMQTTVELETVSTNKNKTITTQSGTMVGYTMLYLHPDIGMMNYYMPVFGLSDALFSIKPDVEPEDGTTTRGTVQITTMINDLKGSGTASESVLENPEAQLVNVKNVFTFHDVYITFQAPQIVLKDTLKVSILEATIDTVLDLGRVNFPISPMTDVVLLDSVFELQQQIIVLPGATLTLDENSVLKMSYYKEKGVAAQKSFRDVKGSALGMSMYYCAAVKKYLSAGIFAPSYNLQSAQSSFNGNKYGMVYGAVFSRFWNYYRSATVNIFGTVEFEGGNNADYVLSGCINVSEFKLSNMDESVTWNAANLEAADFADVGVKMRTYGSFAAIGTSTTGNVGGGQILGAGSGYQIAMIRHYYSLPMISNGIAYLYDEAMTAPVIGRFDPSNGIFTAEGGESYVILSGAVLPEYGNSPTESTKGKGLISFNPTIISVTVHKDTAGRTAKFASDKSTGAQYVFYAGTYVATSGVTAANIVAGTTTCAIDGLLFYSGGLAKTLKWNGSHWVIST